MSKFEEQLAFLKELRELGALSVQIKGEDVLVSFAPVLREPATRPLEQPEKHETPQERRARIMGLAAGVNQRG